MNARFLLPAAACAAVALVATQTPADHPIPKSLRPAPTARFATMPNLFALRTNNAGDRVGYSMHDEVEQSVLWNADGCRDLLPEPLRFSCANGVNDSCHIVGQFATEKVDRGGRVVRQAFLWIDGHMLNIDSIRSFDDSAALAINRGGWTVGWRTFEEVGPRAALWTFLEYDETGPKIIDLGTLGGQHSVANSINDFGLIVGQAETEIIAPPGETLNVAFRYEYPMEVWMTRLPPLFHGRNSAATDVNNAGVIVGWAEDDAYFPHAVVWDNGTVTDLGGFGGTEARAHGINNAGLIVGTASVAIEKLPPEVCHVSALRPFVYRNGAMIDLNQLIARTGDWLLLEARDINDQNQIIGTAWHAGEYWAYVLTLPPGDGQIGALTPAGPLAPADVVVK